MPVSRSVQDFEKQMRAPKWIYVGPWQCDDSTGSTWCYTEGMNIRPATSILREPTELASEGGNLLLNVSPMGDGSIPEPQQKGLREVGDWLGVNGKRSMTHAHGSAWERDQMYRTNHPAIGREAPPPSLVRA